MKKISLPLAGLVSIMILSACASRPVGPSLTVMPGPGKPFDVFQKDDLECGGYAQRSVGTTADDAGALNTAKTAIVGAAVGALAGAVSGGGNSRNAGTGAAIGLVGGTAIGASQGNQTSYEIQRRYDIAYQQCMYSKGNQVPGYSIPAPAAVPSTPPAPPSGASIPPPPPKK
jgi:hypothetical protein